MKQLFALAIFAVSLTSYAQISEQCRDSATSAVSVMDDYQGSRNSNQESLKGNVSEIGFEAIEDYISYEALISEAEKNQYGIRIPVVSEEFKRDKVQSTKKYLVDLYIDEKGICMPTKIRDVQLKN